MLAGKCTDIETLRFPLLATPKLDGIRCLKIRGQALSRKFKPIPNTHIRTLIKTADIPDGLDGEIIIPGRPFNDLSGDVRREDGAPNFEYHIFDFVSTSLQTIYADRMASLGILSLPPFCKKVLPILIRTVEELRAYEANCLAAGYEGVMVRSPNGPYKCGRSTLNEGYLLKIKRFEDDEAEIIDFEEEMENQNVATKDAFGRTERSSHKENLVPKGTLGKLICRNAKWPETFGVGTGYSAKLRDQLWAARAELPHKLIKFKHQPPPVGAPPDDRPRFPVFLGFRDDWDM